MNTINDLVAFFNEHWPASFSLFGVLCHTTEAVKFSENVNVSFPNILFLLKLFEEKRHKNTHLGLYALLNYLQFCYNLLHLWNQITTVTCFSRRERKFFWNLNVLSLGDFNFIALLDMHVANRRTFECHSNFFELLIELSFNFFLGF